MRQARFKAAPEASVAYYHCVSRVVDRRFILGDSEKQQFLHFMRLYETFCGVRILTYCLMSNHFHILLEVPRRPDHFSLSDEELLGRLKPVNTSLEINTLRQKLQLLRAANSASATAEAEKIKATIYARMFDLSAYMKLVKGRFSRWYNWTHKRKGHLWEERFKSVLVESAGQALMTMAAYIDLNPVRAGLVADPKDYRWSGYGEANGSSGRSAAARRALAGLQTVVQAREMLHGGEKAAQIAKRSEILAHYRVWVYDQGMEGAPDEKGIPVKRGFTGEEIAEVLAKKGKLSHWQMLRCRVRYFSDGAVIGSKEFLREIFEKERQRFGKKRVNASHPLRGVDAGELRSLRNLRVKPIG